MKILLLAAVVAFIPFGVRVPAAAAAPGVMLIQWDDDARRHDEFERHREEERHRDWEAERAARWDDFFHARMQEHFEHEGPQWASVPHWEKERIIREEWERWGEHNWRR